MDSPHLRRAYTIAAARRARLRSRLQAALDSHFPDAKWPPPDVAKKLVHGEALSLGAARGLKRVKTVLAATPASTPVTDDDFVAALSSSRALTVARTAEGTFVCRYPRTVRFKILAGALDAYLLATPPQPPVAGLLDAKFTLSAKDALRSLPRLQAASTDVATLAAAAKLSSFVEVLPGAPPRLKVLRPAARICKQVEHWFGDAHWVTDPILQDAYVDNDGLVPVSVMLTYPRLRRLAATVDDVVSAVQGSPVVRPVRLPSGAWGLKRISADMPPTTLAFLGETPVATAVNALNFVMGPGMVAYTAPLYDAVARGGVPIADLLPRVAALVEGVDEAALREAVDASPAVTLSGAGCVVPAGGLPERRAWVKLPPRPPSLARSATVAGAMPPPAALLRSASAPSVAWVDDPVLDEAMAEATRVSSVRPRPHGSPSGPAPPTTTIMSFNILADRFSKSTFFPFAAPVALDWHCRRELLAAEIAAHRPAVACLQEVQSLHGDDNGGFDDAGGHHVAWFNTLFRDMGYAGAYVRKIGGGGKEYRRGSPNLGNCVFYDTRVFEAAGEPVRLSLVDEATKLFPQHRSTWGQYTQVAIAVPLLHLPSRQPVVVVSTHLSSAWRDQHIQLCQAVALVHGAHRAAAGCPNVVICGDFNASPSSAVLEYIRWGKIPAGHRVFKFAEDAGFDLPLMPPSPLLFQSAHEAVLGEVPYTIFNPSFAGVCDYVMVSTSGTMAPVAALDVPSATTLSAEVGVPSSYCGSDHLAMVAGVDFM